MHRERNGIMSGIGKAVSAYQKFQMDMIGKLSVESENMLEEVPFLDEGYIYTQIERLKKEHEDLSRDLKISMDLNLQSDYEQQKKVRLKSKLDKVEIKMLYYALNSFRSLDLCKTLCTGKNIKVTKLIMALEQYQDGNMEQAEELFKEYFSDNSIESAFFLGNKIYGKLLYKKGMIQEALVHLEYAVQLKIDDMEVLLLLEHAYQKTNHELEQKLVSEVCQILGQGGI